MAFVVAIVDALPAGVRAGVGSTGAGLTDTRSSLLRFAAMSGTWHTLPKRLDLEDLLPANLVQLVSVQAKNRIILHPSTDKPSMVPFSFTRKWAPVSHLARVEDRPPVLLERVAITAGIHHVLVIEGEVRRTAPGIQVFDVIGVLARGVPDLSGETEDAAEHELVAEPRLVSLALLR